MNNFSEKVNFIWSIAELVRDTFKRSKYQDVILPLTVLRRIDCVIPHVPDEWMNTSICDHKDGAVGKVDYDINFNRHFYKYQPPRSLRMIEADIRTFEKEIMAMLREVAG